MATPDLGSLSIGVVAVCQDHETVVHTGMRAGSWSGTLPVRQSTQDDSDSPRSTPPPGRMISPTDDTAAAESSISASGPHVPSPRAGSDKDHRRPGGPT